MLALPILLLHYTHIPLYLTDFVEILETIRFRPWTQCGEVHDFLWEHYHGRSELYFTLSPQQKVSELLYMLSPVTLTDSQGSAFRGGAGHREHLEPRFLVHVPRVVLYYKWQASGQHLPNGQYREERRDQNNRHHFPSIFMLHQSSFDQWRRKNHL